MTSYPGPFGPNVHHNDIVLVLSTMSVMGVGAVTCLLLTGFFGYERTSRWYIITVLSRLSSCAMFLFMLEILFYAWKIVLWNP